MSSRTAGVSWPVEQDLRLQSKRGTRVAQEGEMHPVNLDLSISSEGFRSKLTTTEDPNLLM